MAQRPVHYVLSTHWDREWYRTFQDFRFRLVHLMDQILTGWASQRLKGPFQTDGQAIILADYLEVRPEKREEIVNYLKNGMLVAGPWYVMPDEFIVSGEALIRNLRFGRQLVRSLGGTPSAAGFVCDIFGHNSQMPQLFAGFGIQGAFIWRGINDPEHLLLWEGADGTTLPAYKFGKFGYCDFAIQVRHGFEPISSFDTQRMAAELGPYLEKEAGLTAVDPVLLLDTGDHLEWDEAAYAVMQDLMQKPDSSYRIEHTSLDRYLQDLLPVSANIPLQCKGELRQPGALALDVDQQWVIPGVLSSRVWIKQANAACQTLLCQWAEPFSAIAGSFSGYAYPKGYLDVAWKWLLDNHPHNSICGCSIDAVTKTCAIASTNARILASRSLRKPPPGSRLTSREDPLRMSCEWWHSIPCLSLWNNRSRLPSISPPGGRHLMSSSATSPNRLSKFSIRMETKSPTSAWDRI